jgi:hypothetical protein
MQTATTLNLNYLDACLPDIESLYHLQSALKVIERCCHGATKNVNLGDILHDPSNQKALLNAFGTEGYETGLQILLRLALGNYAVKSITLFKEISGKQKLGFLHRALGGWRGFELILSLQFEPTTAKPMILLNPKKTTHWQNLELLPEGTLCTLYLRSDNKKSATQEKLAVERFEAVMDFLQDEADTLEAAPAPVVQLHRNRKPAPSQSSGKVSAWKKKPAGGTAKLSTPTSTLKVVVNKLDTFVHAGNAQMITSHLSGYGGTVKFFVSRGEKKAVSLDPDSIWSAEIRNGETVLFEFFGPPPAEDFLKELAKKVNKYSQMDKVVNE